ncbi:MAG: aminotransferase class V-fold PLP-dependent enzyme [Planctomycetota bacterium]|nr:aminotransferase class V-fold PLP-dependent enzyme [Planctomycetota bacterium]
MQTYFDNAATSFPKPDAVIAQTTGFFRHCGASPGRGAYEQAREASRILKQCRAILCEMVNAKNADLVFTMNCTDALNLAITGITRHHLHQNLPVHIVTTAMDHNSILRVLDALMIEGVTHTIVAVDPKTGLVNPADIAGAITPSTRLVAVAHGSNVTGVVQDIASIGAICDGIPLLIDAAQTMGHRPIDMMEMGLDLIAFPGHKGLLGPLGTGGLIMQSNMIPIIEPIRFGGTGSESESPIQPTNFPSKYESGSHNMVGIYGLLAASKWILAEGVSNLYKKEISLCEQFIQEMQQIDNVQIVGPQTSKNRCGVFSLVFPESPHLVADRLEEIAGIRCRAGLHCAPFAHESMGTKPLGGTVRVSFGPFHTSKDISNLVHAIEQCAQLALV